MHEVQTPTHYNLLYGIATNSLYVLTTYRCVWHLHLESRSSRPVNCRYATDWNAFNCCITFREAETTKLDNIKRMMAMSVMDGDGFNAVEPYRPIIDGVEFTDQPLTLFQSGKWNTDKEYIMGANTEEVEILQFYIPLGGKLSKDLFWVNKVTFYMWKKYNMGVRVGWNCLYIRYGYKSLELRRLQFLEKWSASDPAPKPCVYSRRAHSKGKLASDWTHFEILITKSTVYKCRNAHILSNTPCYLFSSVYEISIRNRYPDVGIWYLV